LNDENLIPFDKLSENERREMGRLGGIKSGESRRRKKTMIEMVKLIGDSQVTDKQKIMIKGVIGDKLKDEELTMSMLVAMTLYQKAIKEKDMKAIEKIFEIDEIKIENKQEYNELSVEELRGLLDGIKQSNDPKD
jgi:hypothetical protein